MERDWRRFAPIGLYVALAAVLFAIGYGIITRETDQPFWISLGLAVIGLCVSVILDPDKARRTFTGRQARHGSNAVLMVFAVLGILVVVNYLVYKNVNDWKIRWDLTEDKTNTLAPETIEVLENLPDTVMVQGFYTTSTSSVTAEELLDQYAFYGGSKFQYEFINPTSDPTAANAAGITQDGTLVFSMGSARQIVTSVTETELTGALIRLMNPGEKVVYFLTGHGEYSPEDGGDQSFAMLKTLLTSKNYTVKVLNLLSTNTIPADASVIVIGGSIKPLSQTEVTLLAVYLQQGGTLVVMAEPWVMTEYGDQVDPLETYLYDNWGVQLAKDIVVDLVTEQYFIAVSDQYAQHAIASKMDNLVTALPTARSVTPAALLPAGVTATPLILTSANSWAETNMEGLLNNELAPDDGVDTFGPISVAVVAENLSTGGRVVVFGDAEFATDGYISAYGNGAMVTNSIDWAAGQESQISLTEPDATPRMLITPKIYTLGLIFLGSVILLPGLVIVGGIVAWVMRKRRG